MDADGNGVTRLTSSSGDTNPSWSFDGSKILFCSNRDHPGTNQFSVYVMNSDGTSPQQLTSDAFDCPAGPPVWSPDGKKIAFTRLDEGRDQIFLMNPDGSDVTNISDSSDVDGEPVWSPHGQKLLFSRFVPLGQQDVYVMSSGGKHAHAVSPSPGFDRGDSWSPDGKKILFDSDRDGLGIYAMTADGKGVTRLTSGTTDDEEADWQPLPRGRESR
jgi:TolB protein